MADNIKIRVRLAAYTRGILPTKISQLEQDIDYVTEAPKDDGVYGRYNGEWTEVISGNQVLIDPGSGLDKEELNKQQIKLSIRQWVGDKEQYNNLPDTENDKTYYVYNAREIKFYLDGGNAFTDSAIITTNMEIDNILGNIIDGGKSTTYKADLYLEGIDSKGE